MKKASIKRRFNKFKEQYPNASSYICFAKAIKGQKTKNETISLWFSRLVNKDDYLKSERMGIINHLRWLTKQPQTR